MSTLPQVALQAAKPAMSQSSSSNQPKPKRRGQLHATPQSRRRTTTTSSKSKATTTMPRKRKASRSQFKSEIAPETENQTSSANMMLTLPTSSNTSVAQPVTQPLFPPCINLSSTTQILPHFQTTSNSLCVKTISTDATHQPLTVDANAYVSDVFDTVFAPQINAPTPILKTVRTVLIKKLLLDHAAQELLTRQIFTFEELHYFTVEILRRSALLS